MAILGQTWTLTKKNLLIVALRHPLSTILRAVLLPILFVREPFRNGKGGGWKEGRLEWRSPPSGALFSASIAPFAVEWR